MSHSAAAIALADHACAKADTHGELHYAPCPGPSSLLHQQEASNRQPAQGCIIRDHPGWCMAATNMYWQKAVLPGTVSGVLLLYCGMLAWGCNMFVAGSTLEISFQKFSAVTMTTSPPSTCSMSARCFPLWAEDFHSSELYPAVQTGCSRRQGANPPITYRLLHHHAKCRIAELLGIQSAEEFVSQLQAMPENQSKASRARSYAHINSQAQCTTLDRALTAVRSRGVRKARFGGLLQHPCSLESSHRETREDNIGDCKCQPPHTAPQTWTRSPVVVCP